MCGVLPLTSIHDDSHVNLHLQAFPELSLRQPGHLSHGHHSIIQQCQLNPCVCVYVHLCSNVHLWEKSANIERWGHTEVTFPLLNSQKDIAFWYLCHTPLTPPCMIQTWTLPGPRVLNHKRYENHVFYDSTLLFSLNLYLPRDFHPATERRNMKREPSWAEHTELAAAWRSQLFWGC